MKLSQHIEALLFLSGEPVKVSRLSEILEKKEEDILEAVSELQKELEGRGICLIKNNEEISLGTSPESSKYCEKLMKEELNRSLGKAGLETLAVVLYKGAFGAEGVARSEIDYIRGVNSTFTLRNLSVRGLVKRKISPADKRSFVYFPSTELLQYLAVTKKEDLPDFEDFNNKIKNALPDTQNS